MIEQAGIHTKDIAHHYDELDVFYRELWGSHLHHGLWETGNESKEEAVVNMSLKVLRTLEDLSGKHLIDIGCGYGETTRLAAKVGAGKVTGITLSQKQAQFAQKETTGSTVDFILGDWTQNSFSDSAFDGGFSIECFSHVNDKLKFFREVKRTLKTGSVFTLTAWLAGENVSSRQKKYLLRPICEEGRLPSLLSKDEIIRCALNEGLSFHSFEDLSEKVMRTWVISISEVLKLIRTKRGLSYFLNSKSKEKLFALTVFRIWWAYRTQCFKYGLFVFYKREQRTSIR